MELPKEMLDVIERQTNGRSNRDVASPVSAPSEGKHGSMNDSALNERRKSGERADDDDRAHSRERRGRGRSRGRSRSLSSGRRRDRRGGGRARSRDDRRRATRRQSRSPDRRRPATQEEARMRNVKCVFVSQLQVKASEEDVEFFFGLFCKVREVALIREKSTGRSKGFGYVELDTIEDVTKALMLSGLPFVWRDGSKGFPVAVRPSEAHKHYLVDQGLAQAPAGSRSSSTAAKAPQVNIELVEMIGPSSCRAKVDGGPVQVLPVHRGKPIYSRLLYVGNLHKTLTDNDIKELFSAFGAIENIQLKLDPLTKQSKGFAFVKFREFASAAVANERMNGYELMGLNLACNPVIDKHQQGTEGGLGGGRETDGWSALDEGESMDRGTAAGKSGGGISLQSQRRVDLMSKLAGGAAHEMMMSAAPPPPTTAVSQAVLPVAATKKIRITNMFDPQEETGADWDKEIEKDTREECEKFGPVVCCDVDRVSREGRCFVTFHAVADAAKAASSLRGRWFGQRQIQVEFV